MDAFSVSIADAMADPKMSGKRKNLVAGTFAFFQFLMPMIGWACVHCAASAFKQFQQVIPYIALALLAFIGGKMFKEGIEEQKSKADELESRTPQGPLSFKMLILQGIATAIDALSVGFTISDYSLRRALGAGFIIAFVTFVICRIGLRLGRKFGLKLAGRATIVGGIILIGIGIEIFVRGIFGI